MEMSSRWEGGKGTAKASALFTKLGLPGAVPPTNGVAAVGKGSKKAPQPPSPTSSSDAADGSGKTAPPPPSGDAALYAAHHTNLAAGLYAHVNSVQDDRKPGFIAHRHVHELDRAVRRLPRGSGLR